MTATNFNDILVTNSDVPKTAFKTRLNELGTKIETNTGNISTAQTDITALETDVTTLQSSVTTINASNVINTDRVGILIDDNVFTKNYDLISGLVRKSDGVYQSDTNFVCSDFIAVNTNLKLNVKRSSLISGTSTTSSILFYDRNKSYLGHYNNVSTDETILIDDKFPAVNSTETGAKFIRVVFIATNAIKSLSLLILKTSVDGISTIEDDISTVQTNITALDARIDINESDIASLQDRPDTQLDNVTNNDLITITDALGQIIQTVDSGGYPNFLNSISTQEYGGNDIFIAFSDAIGQVPFYVTTDGEFKSGASFLPVYNVRANQIAINIDGQSNGFGADFTGLIGSMTILKANTHDNGLKILDSLGVPVASSTAIEAFTATDTGDTANENIAHGMAYWIGGNVTFGSTQEAFYQNASRSGFSLEQLGIDTVPFNASISKINQMKTILSASHLGINLNIECLVQGEAESLQGVTAEGYKQRLKSFILAKQGVNGYNLSGSVPFFYSQIGGHANYTNSNRFGVPQAQGTFFNEYPYASCVCPTYITGYVDGVHMNKYGLRHVGLFFGKAITQFLNTGTFFKPLHPIKAVKYGTKGIIVDFYVPVAPIQFSTTLVTNLDDGKYGFEVWADGTRYAIDTISIFSENQVRIQTLNAITGSVIQVKYAVTPDDDDAGTTSSGGVYSDYIGGRVYGTRGCLCDSDPTTTTLHNNDTGITPNTPYDLRNYCVAFEINVT